MKGNKDPQAAIFIEEEHHYDVDLGVVPFISWEKASGSVRIEIPYDGAVLTHQATQNGRFVIGEVEVKRLGEESTQSIPVELVSGELWEAQIKSNKKQLIQGSYQIDEPDDPLISVDGVVLDDILDEDNQGESEGILGKVEVYSNPLALQLSLWVPDLLAETRPSELYELETMLLRGENTRHIFIPQIYTSNIENILAEGLAALANTAGGTILIGANQRGEIEGLQNNAETKQYLQSTLLKSALLSDPPVPIWRISEMQHGMGKLLVRVEVPASNKAMHRLNSTLYKRQGQANIADESDEALLTAATASSAAPLSESSLNDIFDRDEAGTISFRNQDDVVVLNGSNGLNNLRLGAYICGLINAGKRIGRIIITDLPADGQNRSRFLGYASTESPEQVLDKEMKKLLPSFPTPAVEPRQLGVQKIVIIHLPAWQYPIALYDGQGYQWQNPSLNTIKVEELFDKYSQLTSNRGQGFDDQDAYLELASLNRPIRPPEELERSTSLDVREGLSYDVEYQAQVWQPRPFKRDEDTVGYSLTLMAPLRHASLTFNEGGGVGTKSPQASGEIRIRLNDLVVSGLEVTPQANADNQWFETIPIIKRTYLNIKYTARLNELFKRRTRTSRLRFLIPDVLLDRERVDDLAHVCADVGFRVYETNVLTTASTAPAKATIRGIRGHKYYDISLLIGLVCHRSELTRELQYDGWRDSKSTTTAVLDIRVKLWGTGEGAEREIGRLQMQLYKTISRRLQHLRAE